MNTINMPLYKMLFGSTFIITCAAFGNQHIFSEDQMISKVDISEFPDDCINDHGAHPTMSFQMTENILLHGMTNMRKSMI